VLSLRVGIYKEGFESILQSLVFFYGGSAIFPSPLCIRGRVLQVVDVRNVLFLRPWFVLIVRSLSRRIKQAPRIVDDQLLWKEPLRDILLEVLWFGERPFIQLFSEWISNPTFWVTISVEEGIDRIRLHDMVISGLWTGNLIFLQFRGSPENRFLRPLATARPWPPA